MHSFSSLIFIPHIFESAFCVEFLSVCTWVTSEATSGYILLMETTGLEQKPPGLHGVWKATQDRDLSTQQTGLKPSEVQKLETVWEGWDKSIWAWERERDREWERERGPTGWVQSHFSKRTLWVFLCDSGPIKHWENQTAIWKHITLTRGAA